MPCQRSESGTCLQDTFKPSLGTNRLFPTARLSCKQVPDPSLGFRKPKLNAIGALIYMSACTGGVGVHWIRGQAIPSTEPSGFSLTLSACGFFGSPGMRRMLPVSTTRNSAPAQTWMLRTVT